MFVFCTALPCAAATYPRHAPAPALAQTCGHRTRAPPPLQSCCRARIISHARPRAQAVAQTLVQRRAVRACSCARARKLDHQHSEARPLLRAPLQAPLQTLQMPSSASIFSRLFGFHSDVLARLGAIPEGVQAKWAKLLWNHWKLLKQVDLKEEVVSMLDCSDKLVAADMELLLHLNYTFLDHPRPHDAKNGALWDILTIMMDLERDVNPVTDQFGTSIDRNACVYFRADVDGCAQLRQVGQFHKDGRVITSSGTELNPNAFEVVTKGNIARIAGEMAPHAQDATSVEELITTFRSINIKLPQKIYDELNCAAPRLTQCGPLFACTL